MGGRDLLEAWREAMWAAGVTWTVRDYYPRRVVKVNALRVWEECVRVIEMNGRVGDRASGRCLQLAKQAGCVVYDGKPKRWRWT